MMTAYNQNFTTARGSGCDQRISDMMALVRTYWRMIFFTCIFKQFGAFRHLH